jgi:3-phosphoshikimate 1-carboxyvinyltransferase
MRRIVEPLRAMGARIDGRRGDGAESTADVYPPLHLEPAAGLHGIDYAMPVASGQVKSALLFAGLYAEGATVVREPGPSRDHSERMLRYLGAPVVGPDAGGVVQLDPGAWNRRLVARPITVPCDPSTAAFVLAAAIVAGGRVRVPGVCVNHTRTGFLDVLADMGVDVGVEPIDSASDEPVADLVIDAEPGALRPTTVQGPRVVRAIDELPILAVLASRADGVTWFRDAGELRVKESDRIATTAALLRAFGIDVTEQPDAFAVHGIGSRPLCAARVDAAGDHRIAMAATIAALAADNPSRVDDVANVATSYPTFVSDLCALGADVQTGSGPTPPTR